MQVVIIPATILIAFLDIVRLKGPDAATCRARRFGSCFFQMKNGAYRSRNCLLVDESGLQSSKNIFISTLLVSFTF